MSLSIPNISYHTLYTILHQKPIRGSTPYEFLPSHNTYGNVEENLLNNQDV